MRIIKVVLPGYDDEFLPNFRVAVVKRGGWGKTILLPGHTAIGVYGPTILAAAPFSGCYTMYTLTYRGNRGFLRFFGLYLQLCSMSSEITTLSLDCGCEGSSVHIAYICCKAFMGFSLCIPTQTNTHQSFMICTCAFLM